jgi:hypothetical protein
MFLSIDLDSTPKKGLVFAAIFLLAIGFGPATPVESAEWISLDNKSTAPEAASRAEKPDQTQARSPMVDSQVAPAAYSGPQSPSLTLPRGAGQIWREYDLTPYTMRVTSTKRPEQAIIDWILRETGYELWHGSPLGILSASKQSLKVYHTPETQHRVAQMVRRFTGSQAETFAFGIRVVSVNSPNWRTRIQSTMQPVATQSTGLQAWVLPRENAAVLMGELRRRTDYREYGSPHLLVHNGQSTVVSVMRPRNYIRDVSVQKGAWTSGVQQQTDQIDEGISLEFSPLLSENSKTIDAMIKCNLTDVEKIHSVELEFPNAAAAANRYKIEVPQINQFQFNERFRWPTDQVLLIAMSMVPAPTKSGASSVTEFFTGPHDRVELLVLIESRPKTVNKTASQPIRQAMRETKSYNGRY